MRIKATSKKLALLIFFILASSGCIEDCQPDFNSPSRTGRSTLRQAWSPYVGIHAYGGGENQKPYLEQLIRAGVLKGARVEGLSNFHIQQFAEWLDSQGVEVLGLFENKYLRDPNVYQIFEEQARQNPKVRVWEIGNEVTGFISMSPQEYVSIFRNLFYYVKTNHLDIKLAPQSDGLGEMLDAGLDQLVRDGLQIVTVHFYGGETLKTTRSLEELEKQVARLPGTVQIWVTETSDDNWSNQISHVEINYPRLRSALRAIRIFWYVLSECPSNDRDSSLIKGLPDQCSVQPTPSPLFSALTNGGS